MNGGRHQKRSDTVWRYDRFEKILITLWGAIVIITMLSGNLLVLLLVVASYLLLQVAMWWRRRNL